MKKLVFESLEEFLFENDDKNILRVGSNKLLNIVTRKDSNRGFNEKALIIIVSPENIERLPKAVLNRSQVFSVIELDGHPNIAVADNRIFNKLIGIIEEDKKTYVVIANNSSEIPNALMQRAMTVIYDPSKKDDM